MSLVAHAAAPTAISSSISEFSNDMAEVRAKFAATTNRLVKQYAADIEALKAQYQREGLLDELLAAKNEADRFALAIGSEADPFEEIPEMPEGSIVDKPERLRMLQTEYVANVRKVHDWNSDQTKALADKLLKGMETVQKNLTRRGQINAAIEVRNIVEKLRAAAAENRLVEELAALSATQVRATSAQQPASAKGVVEGDAPVRARPVAAGPVANWKKWHLSAERPFSPDLKTLYDSDLMSPVNARVLEKTGYIYFAAQQGPQNGQQIGGTLCDWSGQATEWIVPDSSLLPVRMKITSEKLAQDGNRGPQLFIYVIGGNPVIQVMPVELMQSECEVKILRDTTDPSRFAIFWPKAARSRPFTVEDGKPVKVVIGVALNGSRQACDTTVQFLQ